MPSATPWIPTYDFASDTGAANLINAAALQGQLQALSDSLASLASALGVSIRDDDTLTDALVRLRNLHPEIQTYLDSLITGTTITQALSFKQPVKVATTANLASLVGLLTIDGEALSEGDRVLVKDQTTASQNGLWIAHAVGGVVPSGVWERAADLPVGIDSGSGWAVMVSDGTVNGESAWALQAGGSPLPVVGTDALPFFPIFAYFPTPVGKGGTGATTAAGARANLGAAGITRHTITGDGSASSFVIAHDFGTKQIAPTLINSAGVVLEEAAAIVLTATTATVSFPSPPGLGVQYFLILVG